MSSWPPPPPPPLPPRQQQERFQPPPPPPHQQGQKFPAQNGHAFPPPPPPPLPSQRRPNPNAGKPTTSSTNNATMRPTSLAPPPTPPPPPRPASQPSPPSHALYSRFDVPPATRYPPPQPRPPSSSTMASLQHLQQPQQQRGMPMPPNSAVATMTTMGRPPSAAAAAVGGPPPPPPPQTRQYHQHPASNGGGYGNMSPPPSALTSATPSAYPMQHQNIQRPLPPPPVQYNQGQGQSQALPPPLPVRPQAIMQQQQQQQQQQLSVPAVPPLFTRPQALGEVDRPLDVYYPKAMTVNVDRTTDPKLPPPADSRFIVLDEGNASPHFIRSTMYAIPTDRQVLRHATGSGASGEASGSSSSSLGRTLVEASMGVLCTPMALPSSDHPEDVFPPLLSCKEDDDSISLPSSGRLAQVPVDYSTNRTAPPRCGRCQAYVNPFWTLTKCNFCGGTNRNVGTHQQHASTLGTVEYPVEGPYVTRRHRPIVDHHHARPNAKTSTMPTTTSSSLSQSLGVPNPVQPNWVVALDITAPQFLHYVDFVLNELWPTFMKQLVQPHTQHNQQNGKPVIPSRVSMVFVAASGIYLPPKDHHQDGDQDDNANLQFTVMPDVQHDPFCPLPLEEWSWTLPGEYESMMDVWKHVIRPRLLPRLIQEQSRDLKVPTSSTIAGTNASTTTVGGYALSSGGAALAFLLDALRVSGGRAVYWTWRRPNYGVGSLLDRERNPATVSSGAVSLYVPLQDAAVTMKASQGSSSGNDSTNQNHNSNSNPPDAPMFYAGLGNGFAQAKVALDIVMHTNPGIPQAFLDVATLSRVCDASSGRFVWMSVGCEEEATWKKIVTQELLRPWYLSGWDAILKVRCSNGWSVKSIVSSVGKLSAPSSLGGNPDELELGVVTPETCVGVTLEHRVGGLPKGVELAFLQTALLYTNPWTGDRRVRVSTLALRTSSNPLRVARAMSFEVLAALQLRVGLPHANYVPALSSSPFFSLDALGSGGHPNSRGDSSTPDQRGDTMLYDARLGLQDACCQILAAYRKLISKMRPPSMSEFLVPPSLDLLPLFVMSALKSPLLRPSLPRRGTGTRSMVPSPRGDERAYYLYHARKVSPATALHLVHPLLFNLGESVSSSNSLEWVNMREAGAGSMDLMGSLKNSPVVDMPPPLQATVSNLDEDGIYLLDVCFALYVLVEHDASFDQRLQSKIANAVEQLQLWSQVGREGKFLRPTACLPVLKINQRDDMVQYQALLRWMVLDATTHEQDFGSFCVELNKRIQKSMPS